MQHQFTYGQMNAALNRAEKEHPNLQGVTSKAITTVLKELPNPPQYLPIGLQQQVQRLQGLEPDANECGKWLATLNHIVALGVNRKDLLDSFDNGEWLRVKRTDEIKKGDQLHITMPNGTEVKGPVVKREGLVVELEMWSTNRLHISSGVIEDLASSVYRKPNPHRYPDPEKTPLIVDNQGNAWSWDGDYYLEVFGGDECSPEDFDPGWTPGKVTRETP